MSSKSVKFWKIEILDSFEAQNKVRNIVEMEYNIDEQKQDRKWIFHLEVCLRRLRNGSNGGVENPFQIKPMLVNDILI